MRVRCRVLASFMKLSLGIPNIIIMNPEQRIIISIKYLVGVLLSVVLISGCSQSDSEKAYLIPVEVAMDENDEDKSLIEQATPTASPTTMPTPAIIPTPTEIPIPTISIGYMGFSGERPTGLVVSECSPLTIYDKDVEGVQDHIDRYDEMCRAAENDGVIFEVRSAFRNYYDQLDYYTSERFGPSVALHPDESMHVAGMAIDLTANSRSWTHEIVGCYDEEANYFTYLEEPIAHLAYAEKVRNGEVSVLCEQSVTVVPIKRSMLFGLTPGCTVLKEPEWWGDPDVVECSSGTLKPNGMVREDWHFENADLISAFIVE
jgi:hypothetical protein